MQIASLSGQETAKKNFQVSYDLRACSDGFAVVWQYYQKLGSQNAGKVFSGADQLRNNASGSGRFAQRNDIPNFDFIASHLGSAKQIFAQLLWRDKGRDRAYIFAVQRNVDVYGNYYYPYTVYEDLQFPWAAWNAWAEESEQNTNFLRCEEERLFALVPEHESWPSPLMGQGKVGSIGQFLSLQKLELADLQLHLISQQLSPGLVESDLHRAVNTKLLEVESPEQLCKWKLRYGEAVRVPSQQIAASTAWRFRRQAFLPYGLTRLQLYEWGAPQRPFPLAYTSYNGKNYVILASFEQGYRLRYLPKTAKQTQDNKQVSGSVIFWLEPVQEIPRGIEVVQEDFQSENYNFDADCSSNGYRRTAIPK